MRKVKYFTKTALLAANDLAIRTKRNRSLYQEKVEELPSDLLFPVGFSIPHNDVEMRVSIAVGPSAEKLQIVWLDLPFELYSALPEMEVPG